MVEDPADVTRHLAAVGEATEVPPRSPGRGPPYWKSRVLRRQVENGGRATGRRSLRLELIEATRHPPVKGQ